ncbi:MAG: hypothetical protein AAF250_07415 [Pseudomonadota bacterium]
MGKGPVIKGLLSGLTPGEKLYLAMHPHHFTTIRDHKDTAVAETVRLFARNGLHNGKGDAFRHCYWSALLARDLGADNARSFTTAHENYSGNPPKERAMDLHNNGVGIGIGSSNKSATDTELSVKCRAALNAGTLMTATPKSGKPY